MADYYRKFLEPEYGEAAPDAIIDVGSDVGVPFDIEHPTEARIRQNFETIARLTQEWKYTFCFPRLMRVKIENLFIDSDGYQLPVRIYKPEGNGPYKTMVFFHGGGWMMNNVDVYDFVHRYFAGYGNVLVIAPDYRLAPEDKFPKGFNDCYNTVVWASQHCAEYGGDTTSLCVCGDSAGGNLAAAVSLRARDEHGPNIAKQFLLFAVTAFDLGYRTVSEQRYGNGEYFLSMNSETDAPIPYLEKPEDSNHPYVSPLFASNLTNLPPACFISAECDPLLDQNLMYAAKLQDQGNQVEYHIYKGMVHAFLNRPQQKTFEAMDDIVAAMP